MKTDNLTSSFLSLRDKLHRSALGFLKNDEDARDALQDTFINLWKRGGVESNLEARNKLFAVLRNVCIDRLRRPCSVPLEEADAERTEAVENCYEDVDRLESLLVAGLTDIQKKIVISVVHENMEYDDIARRMNMSVEAVRMNMSRARKKIGENYNKINR